MDADFAQHAWFGATGYSIADIALYAYTHVADEGGFEVDVFSNLCRWLEQVRAEPGHILLTQATGVEPVVTLDGIPVSPAPAA